MNGALRSALWLGFFGLILWSWWVMYTMAGQMGVVRMNMHDFGPLFVMWAIMMAAMMGPTFVPTLRTYEDLIVSADGTRGGSLGLIAGYFAAWIGFAALISVVQVGLIEARLVTRMGPVDVGLVLRRVADRGRALPVHRAEGPLPCPLPQPDGAVSGALAARCAWGDRDGRPSRGLLCAVLLGADGDRICRWGDGSEVDGGRDGADDHRKAA